MKHGAVASLLFFAACGVGDEGSDPVNPGNMTAAERLCSTTFDLAGTFTIGQPSPDDYNNDTGAAPGDGVPDIQGCWPTGTWRFTLSPSGGDCTPAPTPPTAVEVRVDFVADPLDPAYDEMLISPATAHSRVHISQGGGGLCEGGIELYSDDGKEVYNLHPTLNVFNQSGPLAGSGEFSRFSKNQIPDS